MLFRVESFSYLDMDDAIIELSITPNRADALSMRGVAMVARFIVKSRSFLVKHFVEVPRLAKDKIQVTVEDSRCASLSNSYYRKR